MIPLSIVFSWGQIDGKKRRPPRVVGGGYTLMASCESTPLLPPWLLSLLLPWLLLLFLPLLFIPLLLPLLLILWSSDNVQHDLQQLISHTFPERRKPWKQKKIHAPSLTIVVTMVGTSWVTRAKHGPIPALTAGRSPAARRMLTDTVCTQTRSTIEV